MHGNTPSHKAASGPALPHVQPAAGPALRAWTARFGPIAVRLDLPAAWGELRVPWHGAQDDLPTWTVALAAHLDVLPPASTPNMTVAEWTAASCVWSSTHAAGRLDFATQSGQVQLRSDAADRTAHLELLKETLLMTAAAEVTRRGGLVLHAAVLWHDGRAWVVSGPSTAGKTTLCGRLAGAWWSDEYAYLVPAADGWEVWRHREFRGGDGDFPWVAPLGGVSWLGSDRTRTVGDALTQGDAFARLGYQLLTLGPLTSQRSLDALISLLSTNQARELSHHLGTPVDAVWTALAGGSDA